MRIELFAGLMLALACTTCSRAEHAELVLEFRHELGGQPLVLGQARATRYGQTVAFDHVRYWISNIVLIDEGGGASYAVPDAYYLIEQTPERTRLALELELPAGRWDAIALHLGVDPEPNASLDAMAGELLPGIGMDWSWDTGYKFFRAEGEFEQGDASGTFVFHTGGDELYKRLTAELREPLTLELGERTVLTVTADLDRVFAGLDLPANPEILGGPVASLAGTVTGNCSRMFTLDTGFERVLMQPSSPNLVEDDDGIPSDATPPVLSAALFDPASLSCEAVPNRPAELERACFTPFGLTYDAGMFAAVTSVGAPVFAVAPGVVDEVRFVEHSDLTHSDLFMVTVRPNDDSAFFLEYRSLAQPQVAVGDPVVAGDELGRAGDYYDPAFAALGFAVVRRQELVQRLCPLRYATGEFTEAAEQALALANAAWPEHVADSLCSVPAVVCVSPPCEAPGDFVPAFGDVDSGRRLYASGCASCHGSEGEGDIAPPLCSGPGCPCSDCVDHATLAARIAHDMPPEGSCTGECADDVAAFILHELIEP